MNVYPTGSGGFGAVSIGIAEPIIALILLVVVIGVWKLVKVFWAMLSS